MKLTYAIVLFSAALAAAAQQSDTPKKALKRSPPNQLLDQSDSKVVTGTQPVKGSASAANTAAPQSGSPKPVVVPETGKQAQALSNSWIGASNAPAPGADGRVMFTFGQGLPVITCALQKICVIELQAGEHITGAPLVGDSVRWTISPSFVGKEPYIVPLILLKPLETGLDTNLVIATDRRAYYIRLISERDRYVARTAFNYPTDSNDEWTKALREVEENRDKVEKKRQEEEIQGTAPVRPEIIGIENWNHSYRLTGDAHVRPVMAVDDGRRMVITMNQETMNREIPVLMASANGKEETINYRISGNTYIVDRLADHLVVISGTGKHQRRAWITRGNSAEVPRGTK